MQNLLRHLQFVLVALGLALLPVGVSAAGPLSSISYGQVIKEASTIAAMNPAWSVMRSGGTSMDPQFGDSSILLVERASVESLRPGMTAVYRDSEGDLVAHNVVEVGEEGAVMRGINNTRNDPELVTADNLVGIVFCTLYSSGADSSGESLPLALGKHY